MTMWEALERLLSGSFMPHGHCYLWTPEMVWLQVVANLLIGGAYVAISSALYVIVRRIEDLPFSWMYFAFGIFIITCGGTHFLDVLTIWHPVYWLDGGLRAVTAVASVGTAVLLFALVPKAIALAGAAQIAQERGQKLEEMFKELAEAHAKNTELARLRNELYANVSHELRTPLTLVLGPTERLLRSATTTDAHRLDLEIIARNGRTLLKYVNDLLDVAKVEAGKLEVDYVRADAREVVVEASRHFEGLAAERRITLTIDAPEPVAAELDVDKIERVVLNLLSNAFKVTPTSGVVRCAVSASDGRVRIEIADSGPGVPAELRASLFERFVQGNDEARRAAGSGLGLAIAKEFSELHGGAIRIETAAEGGAAFIIELPQKAPEGSTVRERGGAGDDGRRAAFLASATTAIAAPLPAPIDDGTGVLTRATVLVVEDNREMGNLVSQTLATAYLIERAYDGEEGIAKARALRPDLIITDLMMPRRNGEELVRAVRLDRQLDRVPIVLLSARSDHEVRARVLDEGAQDYLTKPFSEAELLTRVGNLITTARLKTAHLRAAEASKLKTDFLGLVSHELRTPLTAMQLLMDRLVESESTPLPARERQIVDRLAAATTRLTHLVDTLLHYARIQSGHLAIDVEPFDLAALAAEALEEVRPQAQRKSLELVLQPPDQRVRVESDPKLVRLVIVNLVSNAVKFTVQGSVSVSVANDGERRILRVSDTGPGIAAAQQQRIFEPFQQLEPTKHKHQPGVGLGLSLVRQIVDNLGASIAVRSEVGKGSTFEVSMPATHPDARAIARGS